MKKTYMRKKSLEFKKFESKHNNTFQTISSKQICSFNSQLFEANEPSQHLKQFVRPYKEQKHAKTENL